MEIGIEDLQEIHYAFRYYLSYNSANPMLAKNEVVKFDDCAYGSGVVDGIFTAPVGNCHIF